jgi:hypothetical protein
VIESTDFQIDISAPGWTLSTEEEEAQIAACHQALRAWLDRLDAALEEAPVESAFAENSFEIEEEQKLFDRLTNWGELAPTWPVGWLVPSRIRIGLECVPR